MNTDLFRLQNIPVKVWGRDSEKAYLFVHGKLSSKEAAAGFAEIAQEKGFQTVSFDLARHGERKNSVERCDIWRGIEDLNTVAKYVFSRWKQVSLYACSLGAYFSLNAYADRTFEKCLFQSPILDMNALIHRMMMWFDVTEERLEKEGEVDTPIDTLSWNYYRYVRAHPVEAWPHPTRILYAAKDELQDINIIRRFSEKHRCRVTVAEQSEHAFMAPEDGAIVERWLRENI